MSALVHKNTFRPTYSIFIHPFLGGCELGLSKLSSSVLFKNMNLVIWIQGEYGLRCNFQRQLLPESEEKKILSERECL